MKVKCLFLFIVFVLLFNKNIYAVEIGSNDSFIDNGKRISIDEVLLKNGFLKFSPKINSYIYVNSQTGVSLNIGTETSTFVKSGITTYINNRYKAIDGKNYVDTDILSKAIDKSVSVQNGKVVVEDYKYEPHSWVNMNNGLVAHGGGGLLGIAGLNAYESVITNYSQGFTVFEMDFNLTTDKQMVAVHDWERYKKPMSLAEYKQTKLADVFTSLELEDIYKIMMVNKDFYLILDTKSFEYSNDDIKIQFQQIYDKAKKYDIKLLDRIVPQIYNQEMYGIVKSVYNFKSIIYTLYASSDTNQQVIDFVKDKADIKVVAMWPERFSEEFKNGLAAQNKLIYLYTLNDINQMKEYKQKGVSGFYTDFVTPSIYKDGMGL